MAQVQVIKTGKQVHTMSSVPLTGGEPTILVFSGRNVQFGTKAVYDLARRGNSAEMIVSDLIDIMLARTM